MSVIENFLISRTGKILDRFYFRQHRPVDLSGKFSESFLIPKIKTVNPKTAGGGVESTPPSTFCATIPPRNFF